jgi:outer membrane protein assembly factor BamD
MGWVAVGLLALGALAACGPKQTPLSQLTPEDLWLRGIAAYNEEDWTDAVRYFDRYAVVAGADPRVYQARMYSAQAHFNRHEYVTAATEFSRLSGDLGRTALADDARFMTCRSYEELSPDPQLDQEYTQSALEHCQALVDTFPDSEFRDRAEEIVAEMWGKLGEKAFETADWYQGRRAYDSAIIYYDDVVDRYPHTRWAPRALSRLVQIYGILQWDTEQQETRNRLLNDYPDSPEAQSLAGP